MKKPISFYFRLLWEFICPSDLQYKSASLTEIDTVYMKSSVLPLGKAAPSLRRDEGWL